MAFPSSPKNKEFFSPNLEVTYQYNDNDNAWFKVNAKQKYIESVDYSFALKRTVDDFSNPVVGEDQPFSYLYEEEWDYNFEDDDSFSVPTPVSGYYEFTLPYSVPSQDGVPQRETLLINEVYSEEAVVLVGSGAMLSGLRYRHETVGRSFAALTFGGDSGSGFLDSSESFNGYTWTSESSLNTARRYLAGAGEEVAAISFGGWSGIVLANTEIYDGSSWSNSSSLNVARNQHGAAGRRYAALAFGGYDGSVYLNSTEIFDGFNWSVSSGTLNLARSGMGQAGFSNAALAFAGFNGGIQVKYEKFNGNSWTDEGNIPVATAFFPSGGSQNDAFAVTGTTNQQGLYYNGSVWSLTGTFLISSGTDDARGAGTASYGLVTGGSNFGAGETHIYYRPDSKRRIALFTDDTNRSEIPFDNANVIIDGSNLSITTSKVSNPSTSQINVQHSTDDRVFRTIDLSAKFKRINEEQKYEITHSPIETNVATSGSVLDFVGNPFESENEVRGSYLYCYQASNSANEDEEIKIESNLTNQITLLASFPQSVSVGDKFYVKKPQYSKVFRVIDERRTCVNVDVNEYDNLYYLRINPGGYLDPLDSNNFFNSEPEVVANLNYSHQLNGGDSDIVLTLNGSQISSTVNNYRFDTVIAFNQSKFLLTDFSFSRDGVRFDEVQKEIVYEAIEPNYTYTIQEYGEVEIVADNRKSVDIINNQGALEYAWSSSADTNIVREKGGTAGKESSFLVWGIEIGNNALATQSTASEQFNGASWEIKADINFSTWDCAGDGQLNSAIYAGGYANGSPRGNTEIYNGTSWSQTTELITPRNDHSVFASSANDALATAGNNQAQGPPFHGSEKFNGFLWTQVSGGELLQPRTYQAGGGISNAAVIAGGLAGGTRFTSSEVFNGGFWVSAGNLVSTVVTTFDNPSAFGALTDCVIFQETSVSSEIFNGIFWSLTGAFPANTGEKGSAAGASSVLGMKIGGINGNTVTETFRTLGSIDLFFSESEERFLSSKKYLLEPNKTIKIRPNKSSYTTLREVKGSLNVARNELGPAIYGGINSAILTAGDSVTTEEWNGESWSSISSDISIARRWPGSFGGINSSVLINGSSGAGTSITTEYYNGDAWSSGINTPVAIISFGATGIFNAGIYGGGQTNPSLGSGALVECYKFNGTTWASVSDLNQARRSNRMNGSQNDAITTGGFESTGTPTTTLVQVETFDGTSWTISSYLNSGRDQHASAGNSTTTNLVGGFDTDVGSFSPTGARNISNVWATDTNSNYIWQSPGSSGIYDEYIVAGTPTNCEISRVVHEDDIIVSY